MPVVEGCRAVDPRVVDENPVLSERNEPSFTFLVQAHKLYFKRQWQEIFVSVFS
jgi:hypothetical protein